MANMTAEKKRPKGGAEQSSEQDVGNKIESADSIKTTPEMTSAEIVSAVNAAAAASGRAVTVQAPAEDEQLLVVREYVSRAAQILQSLGPEYERVAWLLEDTLSYLEDADEDEEMAFEKVKIEEL